MLWNDITSYVSDIFAESIDNSDDFVKKENIKYAIALKQTGVSREIKCLDSEGAYTFNTVQSTTTYSLPSDYLEATEVRWRDEIYLDQTYNRPMAASDPQGTPMAFFIEGSKIGLYPTPNEVSTVSMWYKRLAPPYAADISFTNTNTSATAATFSCTALQFSVTVAGGVHSGTSTFDLTSSSYDTMSELVAGVNAVSGVACTIQTLCPAAKPTTQIEVQNGKSIISSAAKIYLDPELPEEMHEPILVEHGLYLAKLKNKNYTQASFHKNNRDSKIYDYKKRWPDRYMSIHANSVNDAYSIRRGGAAPLGKGGMIIVP